MKKYVLISDFCLTSRNRGTAALGYGSLAFLKEKGYLKAGQVVVDSIQICRNPFHRSSSKNLQVQGEDITFHTIRTSVYEYKLWEKFGISL